MIRRHWIPGNNWGASGLAIYSVGAPSGYYEVAAPNVIQFTGVPVKRFRVERIIGRIDCPFKGVFPTAGTVSQLFCGIFLGTSQLYPSVPTSDYDRRDPSNGQDVVKDWLYLDYRSEYMPGGVISVPSGPALVQSLNFAIDIRQPVIISPGQAILVAVASSLPSSRSLLINLRYLVSALA